MCGEKMEKKMRKPTGEKGIRSKDTKQPLFGKPLESKVCMKPEPREIPASILVIDENPRALDLYNSALKEKAGKLTMFSDPAEALESMEAKMCNIVIIGYRSREGDSVVEEIKGINPTAKILLVTGATEGELGKGVEDLTGTIDACLRTSLKFEDLIYTLKDLRNQMLPQSKKTRLVVIDETPEISTLYGRILKDYLSSMTEFNNPEKALESAEVIKNSDIVIVGYRFRQSEIKDLKQDTTANEVIPKIKQINPKARIILSTGGVWVEEAVKLSKSPMVDCFITKPFHPDALLKAISRLEPRS